MNQFSIRQAVTTDIQVISDWNRAMAWETEQKDLAEQTIYRGVQRLMEKPEYGFYLIAETDSAIAGTLMVTTEWSDWRDGLFWWVQSVYVAPDFRRQGVYTALYNKVRELASANPDVCGFRLYVEKENQTAQSTYESLGMSATDYLLYEEVK